MKFTQTTDERNKVGKKRARAQKIIKTRHNEMQRELENIAIRSRWCE